MKIFLSAKRDSFWESVVDGLALEGLDVVYWIGLQKINTPVQNCFLHDISDPYEFKNKYTQRRKVFDIGKVTLEEYYNYLKILDRVDDGGGLSFSERDRLYKDQLNYWFLVLSELLPDFIVFSNVPHLPYDYPLYVVAKSMGIETMIFNVAPFRGWHFLTSRVENNSGDFFLNIAESNQEKISDFYSIAVQPYLNGNYQQPRYMQKQIEFDSRSKTLYFMKKLLFGLARRLKRHDRKVHFKKKWIRNITHHIGEKSFFSNAYYKYLLKKFKKRLYQNYLNSTSSEAVIKKLKTYIYIPLHYQPEATTTPLGGMYSDQIFMIETLREYLSSEITFVVKEHYSQFRDSLPGNRGRNLDFWNMIKRIENTYIADTNFPTQDLIINSLAVATITGTAGWEAIQYGKRCIVFGSPWYISCPGAIRFNSITSKEQLMTLLFEEDISFQEKIKFAEDFCQRIVKTDLHNSSEGRVSRDENIVVDCIKNFSTLIKR